MRLAAFLDVSGFLPGQIRDASREPGFLAGVLEHMLADESLLVAFAAKRRDRPGRHSAGVQRTRPVNGNAISPKRGLGWCRELLPRLPCRCFADPQRAAQAAARPACCAIAELDTPCHRPCRLRRLLRHHRETRRSGACRRAGDRRRRQARRRRRGLLRRAHFRREIGDADVRGVATLSACQGDQAQYGKIRTRRPRSPRHDARPDAAGGAAVDRRGLSRFVGHRAAARHDAREGARALRGRRRKIHRHHGFDRTFCQQVPRQDRFRPRQAARLRGSRRQRGAKPSSRRSPSASSSASARSVPIGWRATAFIASPICSARARSS